MSELFLLVTFIFLAVRFRASYEERELRSLKHQHQWDLIKYRGEGKIAILALHGFGVCPQLFDPWFKQWRTSGWGYRIPMLTGSVQSLYSFENSKYQDWEAKALDAYDELEAQYEKVFVVGFSNGGLMALRVAHLRSPTALVLLAPFFGLATPLGILGEYILSKIRNFPPGIFIPNKSLDCSTKKGVRHLFRFKHSPLRAVLELLKFRDIVVHSGDISCPVFWSHSKRDHVASYSASLKAVSELSADVKKLPLQKSFHYILHDVESKFLEKKVIEFLSNQANSK